MYFFSGDPTVETFVVRDLDSLISQREADAVDEWLRSSKRFHVMRDAPQHKALFLGGLWGAHNYHRANRLHVTVPSNNLVKFEQTKSEKLKKYESQARHWLDRMLTLADGLGYKGLDQRVLNEVLGPVVTDDGRIEKIILTEDKNELMSHDSYTCEDFPESRPWPTARRGREFVGSPSLLFPEVFVSEQCPWECRPNNHKSWLYC